MKILITGATGLVGKSLGIELVRQGHELVVVSRNAREARKNCPFPCEVIEADLNIAPLAPEALNGVEGVINLMGEPIAQGFWNKAKKERLRQSRITATRHLVQSFESCPPKVFISASAIGFYGSRADEKLAESASAGEDFLAQLCVEWEREATVLKQNGKTRVCVIRIGLILSSLGGMLAELTPIFRAGLGGPIAGGQQWMSWIHLDDVVQSILFSLSNPQCEGAFNAVAPHPTRNNEFSKTLAKLLHRPALLPVPRIGLTVLFQEKASLLTASQNVVPEKLIHWGFKFKFDSLDLALRQELESEMQGEDVFLAQQYLPLPPEKLFPFFSDANNLEKITPKTLKFKILNVSTPGVQQGTLIDYSLRIHGIPVHWKTEIENWNPPYEFVDNQLKGPYALWHHTHRFSALGPGTLMTDRVRFRVPLGTLGWLAGGALIRKEVEGIFSFRRQIIDELFTAKV